MQAVNINTCKLEVHQKRTRALLRKATTYLVICLYPDTHHMSPVRRLFGPIQHVVQGVATKVRAVLSLAMSTDDSLVVASSPSRN